MLNFKKKRRIKVFIFDRRSLKKEEKTVQKAILTALDRLRDRYQKYVDDGLNIKTIFNDDVLIHNIIDKDYYVYKTKVGVQLRILYMVSEENNDITMLSYYIKNRLHTVSRSYSAEYKDIFKRKIEMFKKQGVV